MNSYHITNRTSGADLGIYDGDTLEAALDAMARDAGYRDRADAIAIIGGGGDIEVELVTPLRS